MKYEDHQHLRTVLFRPYISGMPTFTLRMWDTYRHGAYGKSILAYELRMHSRYPDNRRAKTTVLFEGEDFGCAPSIAIDSDECVAALMGFLTLRPGDTDDEHFEQYTPDQMAFAQTHGETLACEVMIRFENKGD